MSDRYYSITNPAPLPPPCPNCKAAGTEVRRRMHDVDVLVCLVCHASWKEDLYTPNSIRTVSGRYVNILKLDPETIIIEDIAHGLSMTPRFGGHLPEFYSVAQHSLVVCDLVKSAPREVRLQALLHDASEYLIGDMPSPIKQHLPDFRALEDRIMQVIASKFNFPWPMLHEVKKADRVAMGYEWDCLMLQNHPRYNSPQEPWRVRSEFMNRFREIAGIEPPQWPT